MSNPASPYHLSTARRIALALVLLVLLSAAYLLAWPLPIQPVSWTAPIFAGYAGVHAPNRRLAELTHLSLDGDVGPEHVVVRDDSTGTWVWVAVASADYQRGRVIRMRPDGSAREVMYESSGRPLGFDFASDGSLIVADPAHGTHGGIQRVTGFGASARVELLTDNVDGVPLPYVDAVVVASNGRIYFSNASERFGVKAHGGTFEASLLDIFEQRCTGRVLEYDPASRTTRTVIRGLCFANGVALSGDERRVIVAETGAYRVWTVAVDARDVDAQRAAATPDSNARVLLENLPGFPDNVMRGHDGRFWTGFTKPRSGVVDKTSTWPLLRAMVMRLPRAWWPVPPAYGHVIAFDESGKILVDLQDPAGSYPETTAITEAGDRWFVQSLHASTLGVLQPALVH